MTDSTSKYESEWPLCLLCEKAIKLKRDWRLEWETREINWGSINDGEMLGVAPGGRLGWETRENNWRSVNESEMLRMALGGRLRWEIGENNPK